MQNTPIEIFESLSPSRKRLLGLDLAPPKDEFTRVRSRANISETPQDYVLPLSKISQENRNESKNN